MYLIRINYQRFAGPFTIDELRKAYQNMEFGLQDEVAGHRGKWVTIDDFESIKREYPELTKLIKDDLFSSWGMSQETKIIKQKKRSKAPAKSKPNGLLRWTLSILAILFIVIAILKRREVISFYQAQQKDPTPYRALNLYRARKLSKFDHYIKTYREDILKTRNPKSWISILRIYAYRHGGALEGLSQKALKGRGASIAPPDCSHSSWNSIFKERSDILPSLINGHINHSDRLLKVLLWDPYWIKRRNHADTWIEPSSYFEACIEMAIETLDKYYIGLEDDSWRITRSRFAWLLAVSSKKNINENFDMEGPLWHLSCIEQAESFEELDACQSSGFHSSWNKLLQLRTKHRRIWILIGDQENLSKKKLDQLKELSDSLKTLDPSSKMEYIAELRFFQEIVFNGGHIQLAEDKTIARFPNIRQFR